MLSFINQINDNLLSAKYLIQLWDGFLLTLTLSLFTIIISTVFGFLLAMLEQNPYSIIRRTAKSFTAFFRYSPLLPQLFFWYFGIGNILPEELKEWIFNEPQIDFNFFLLKMPSFEFIMGLIGLTFYSSSFISEEFKAGILGVRTGQIQASLALGLTRSQALRFIVLPQAFRIAFPPLIGQYMNIIKNSSLTMAIGVFELSYVSRSVETETLKTFQDYTIATLLYVVAVILVGSVGNIYHHKVLIKGTR